MGSFFVRLPHCSVQPTQTAWGRVDAKRRCLGYRARALYRCCVRAGRDKGVIERKQTQAYLSVQQYGADRDFEPDLKIPQLAVCAVGLPPRLYHYLIGALGLLGYLVRCAIASRE